MGAARAEAGCGLGQDRGMLTVYAPSIWGTHRLAERILIEGGRFRRMPERWRPRRRSPRSSHAQLSLLSEFGESPDNLPAVHQTSTRLSARVSPRHLQSARSCEAARD